MPRVRKTEDQSFEPQSDFSDDKGNYSVIPYEVNLFLIQTRIKLI